MPPHMGALLPLIPTFIAYTLKSTTCIHTNGLHCQPLLTVSRSDRQHNLPFLTDFSPPLPTLVLFGESQLSPKRPEMGVRFYLSDNNGSKIKAHRVQHLRILERARALLTKSFRLQSPVAAMKLIVAGLLALLSLSQLCTSLDDDYIELPGYAEILVARSDHARSAHLSQCCARMHAVRFIYVVCAD
jgi:hypothetical protein